jgi:hypothetical protein
VAVTDTPIYDQLRLELSSRREPQEAAPPRQRSRAAEKPARQAPTESSSADAGQPVSVWTLVNANRRRKP